MSFCWIEFHSKVGIFFKNWRKVDSVRLFLFFDNFRTFRKVEKGPFQAVPSIPNLSPLPRDSLGLKIEEKKIRILTEKFTQFSWIGNQKILFLGFYFEILKLRVRNSSLLNCTSLTFNVFAIARSDVLLSERLHGFISTSSTLYLFRACLPERDR